MKFSCEDCKDELCEKCANNITELDYLKEKVDKGLLNNTVIYDSDALSNQFTIRLFLLIVRTLKNLNKTVKRLIVPMSAFVDVIDHPKVITDNNYKLIKIYNTDIEESYFLGEDKEIFRYIDNKGCILANDDDCTIIIETTDKDVYLASY